MLPKINSSTLVKTAFTHRSYLNEHPEVNESYERLEFLGDAVIELEVSLFLFRKYSTEPEGVLTNLRSSLVNTRSLASVARTLQMGEQILLSKGEDVTGARLHDSLLADIFEAFVGALYLDQGFDEVEKFLAKNLFPQVDEIRAKKLEKDAKSKLQELVQAQFKTLPAYIVLHAAGPDHQKTFTIAVEIKGKTIATGTGPSKQEAQQLAAESALEKLQRA